MTYARDHESELLEAALAYAASGLLVFPVHSTDDSGACSCGRLDCGCPGKHPRTAHGHLDATTEPGQIRAWWTTWPKANIAMNCGASGRVVIDVDDKDDRPGPDTWHALKEELGVELEESAIVETPSGGFHAHYLVGDHRVGSRNDLLGAGIDVKAEGGYVLLPPSSIGGIAYVWIDGFGIEKTAPIAEALASRIEYVARPARSPRGNETLTAAEQIPKGRRNETLFGDACAMRRRGHSRAEIQAAITEKNKRCLPRLSGEELRHLVGSAMKYEPAEGEEAAEFACTDAGNAELFCALNAEHLRYDHRRGAWFRFSEHHWVEDGDGAVYRLAIAAVRKRYQRALEIGDLPSREVESKFAIRSENRQRLEAMLALARCQLPIATAGDGWNRDPLALACANGVIDLATGRLRAGLPDELISISSGVPHDPDAGCPRWERFLTEIFQADEELIDWIWRVVGYLLSALTYEQFFLLCYGVGANGKSTFLNVLRQLLGGYAFNAPFTTFEASSRGQIPNDLAALVDRRLVTSSETGENTRLNEARLKMLTGGDPVTARFLHREFFTFAPVAKFVLAVNHKPQVRDYSHGFWRRLCLVPFEVRFEEGTSADKQLDKKLAAELPGILTWAVRGHAEWRSRGLEPPSAVRAATAAYRAESDPLAAFLCERCFAEKGAATKAATIFDAYLKWADEQVLPDCERLARTTFYQLLESHFPKRHTKTGNLYLGLRIVDPDVPMLDEAVEG